MRGRFLVGASIALAMAAGAANAQDWHQGKGRLEGVVSNTKGEPIAGAQISLRWHDMGPDLKADKSGHWATLGLSSGAWDVDFSAPGYLPKKVNVNVSDVTRIPPMKVQLEPEPQKVPVAEPKEPEVRVGGKVISKETTAALERGNAAMKDKRFAEAEDAFRQALTELPEEPSLLYTLALTYYFDNKQDPALEFARKTVAADPQKTEAWLLVSELELRKGNLDAGRDALAKVPAERLTSPEPYMDIGILSYNKKRYAEADEAFSKAIAMKPDLAQAYYYRGLERLAAKKNADGKADLQKFLQLSPTGEDADSAKEILKSLR